MHLIAALLTLLAGLFYFFWPRPFRPAWRLPFTQFDTPGVIYLGQKGARRHGIIEGPPSPEADVIVARWVHEGVLPPEAEAVEDVAAVPFRDGPGT